MCLNMIATAGSSLFGGLSPFIEGLGTAMSVAGPIMQGRAQQQAAEAQAKAAEYNAEIAETQAEIRSQEAAKEERMLRVKGRLAKGTQRAAFGAAGLNPNAGSPLDILLDTQQTIEEDASTIRYNAELDRWGLGERAKMFRYQGKAAEAAGDQAMVAGTIGGITNLGTSMSRFSDRWNWMSNSSSGSPIGTGKLLPGNSFYTTERLGR